jgi:hypothetical protein
VRDARSNPQEPPIRIEIATFYYENDDLQSLADSIRAAGIGDKLYIETYHGWHLVVDAAIAIGALAGKKAIDIIADLAKKWLENRPEADEIVIYGPDGKPVKIVHRDGKTEE